MRCGMKFRMDDKSIIIILKNIKGEIIKLALAITFKLNRLQNMLLVIKNSVIYNIGDVLKYIILRVSERFFIIDTVSITTKAI